MPLTAYGLVDGRITTKSILVQTTSYTASNIPVIYVDAATAGGNVTIDLPDASENVGVTYNIKKVDSSAYSVTIDPYSTQTIDGDDEVILYSEDDGTQIHSDGSNWKVIGGGTGGASYNATTVTSSSYYPLAFPVVLCSTITNDIDITLPSAATQKNKAFFIKNVGSGAVNVISTENIDNSSDSVIITTTNDAITFISDGTNYWKL